MLGDRQLVGTWGAEQLRMRPKLLLCAPYGMEGTHTVPGTDKVIEVNHNWDSTFGYAFGVVALIGEKVTEIAPGDVVTFTRHAYEAVTDKNGDEWLVVNTEDCLAIIENGENAKGADRVE